MSAIQSTLPTLLNLIDAFGKLSGFKINLGKSALMLLKLDWNTLNTPPDINIVGQVNYLGT